MGTSEKSLGLVHADGEMMQQEKEKSAKDRQARNSSL